MKEASDHWAMWLTRAIDRAAVQIGRHWFACLNTLLGVWVVLPWLAPVFMHIGATLPARWLYAFYGLQCHQLPQRSYFLFGSRLMIPPRDILAVFPVHDPLSLRPFIGNAQMGWKVAWSDRMVALYTPLFVGGLLYARFRQHIKPLSMRAWLLCMLPLVLDGLSHLVNDLFALSFRDNHVWLAALTGHALPATFYAGDAIGSINWWLRLLTGLLAGFATTWALYPRIDRFISLADLTHGGACIDTACHIHSHIE